MKFNEKRDIFTIAALTITWLLTIPLEIAFFTRVIGWPLDLALLILLPFVLIWIPASYPLAIEGNHRHQRGEGMALTRRASVLFGSLGVLTAVLTVAMIWAYGLRDSGAPVASIAVALVGGLTLLGSMALVRKLLRELRGVERMGDT